MYTLAKMKKVPAIIIVSLLLSVVSGYCFEHANEETVKNAFIYLEEAKLLKDGSFSEKVEKIYTVYYPSIRFVPYSFPIFYDRKKQPSIPEYQYSKELADWHLKNSGLPHFHAITKRNYTDFIRSNLSLFDQYLNSDLHSENIEELGRALNFIGDFRITKYTQKVRQIFLTSDKLESKAAYVLRDLGSYESIPDLVKKPDNLMEYFELLRNLQKGRKAHKEIVNLLEAKDTNLRWRAAYSLAESGDPTLLPHCKKLLKDPDPMVRRQALNIGFLLEGDSYNKIYSELVRTLKDPDRSVRIDVVCSFAWRKDSVCARTLLELLKDGTMEETWHSNIWQAMNNLTGSYFGYYHGSDAWKPDTENNKKAIERFEEWIKEKEL